MQYKQRADGRYLAQITIGRDQFGKPRLKNVYANTPRELAEKVSELKYKKNNGVLIDDRNTKLSDWSIKWLEAYKSNLSPNTRAMYESCVKKICADEIGSKRLSKLRAFDLQDFLNREIAKGLTRTVEQLRLTLKQIFKQAYVNDLIPKNIAESTQIPIFNKKQKRAISPVERQAIFSADFSEREKLFVFIALFCGLRRGEILALTTSDIDFIDGTISVNKNLVFENSKSIVKPSPKTESGRRIVPVPDILMPLLQPYEFAAAGIYIFTMKNGATMTKSSYVKFWAHIAEKINLSIKKITGTESDTDITAHILRHSYATSLFYAGIDAKTAQKLLGHSNISITMDIYTHLTLDTDSVKDKLSAYLNSVSLPLS